MAGSNRVTNHVGEHEEFVAGPRVFGLKEEALAHTRVYTDIIPTIAAPKIASAAQRFSALSVRIGDHMNRKAVGQK